jgi:hypothetical protein
VSLTPQNPFTVEIRLADSEEIQTDFEVKEPDEHFTCPLRPIRIGEATRSPQTAKRCNFVTCVYLYFHTEKGDFLSYVNS